MSAKSVETNLQTKNIPFGEDSVTAIRRLLLSTGLCLLIVLLGLAPAASAQQSSSAISGTITSADGKPISGASVSAQNEGTGETHATTSNAAGAYSIFSLEAGLYTVTVKNTGSRTTIAKGILASVARRGVLDVRLEAGDQAQVVQSAAGSAQLMESESAVLGAELPPSAQAQIPLFVNHDLRNIELFATWLPGVTNGTLETDISGGLRRGKEVLIDGASGTSAANGGVANPFPTGGQLSELRLLTASIPAEIGRTSGGVEVWVARRGTDSPHGEVYDFIRNDALDAAGWAVNSTGGNKPKLRENEYGFQLGAPVFIPEVYDGRHKSFFNVSLSDYKQNDSDVTTVLTIPTLAERNGDFTLLTNSAGQQIPIYDPASLTDKGFGFQRTVFDANKIPASRFSTVSKNVQAYLPDPTFFSQTNNYLGHVRAALTRYAWGVRGDQALSMTSRVSFYASVQKNDSDTVGPLPDELSNGNRQYLHSQLYRVNYGAQKKADRTSQFTFGYNRSRNFWDRHPDQIQNWSQTLGLNGVENGGSSSFPVVNFTNGDASFGRYTDLETNGGLYDRSMTFGYLSTHIMGRHEIRIGGDVRLGRYLQSPVNNNGVQGVFNFSGVQTASPSDLINTGDAFASFLLGYVDSATRVFTSLAPDFRTAYTAIFIDDHFKVNPRFTVDIGLRYDLPFSRWDNNSTYSSLDPNLANPGAAGRKGALVFAGTGAGHTGSKEFGDIDATEIGPRVGAAYKIDEKTVVRGGWGILYANGNGLTAAQCNNCTLGSTSVVQRISNGLQEAFLWDAGLTPQSSFRLPPSVDPSVANGGPVTYIDPNNSKAPRFQNYSVDVQRSLPMGVLLDGAFVGNHGTRLSGPLPLNQVDPKYLSLGSLLGLQITDPKVKAAGFSAPYAGFTGTLAQALRPFPQYTDVTSPYAANLHSDYKALQIRAEKAIGSFDLQANYTYSKKTSNGASSLASNNLLAPQNQYNLAPQESLAIDDLPHVLNLVYSWQLPFGPGKRFLGTSHGVVAALTGGWSVAAQQVYRSGALLLVTAPNSLGSGAIFSARTQPNVTGTAFRTGTDAGSLDPNNASNHWINPAAYSLAPAYTLGNAANFYGDVRNPSVKNENFSAIKRTPLREGLYLEYRADFQNLFNRTEFGNINANLGDPAFGRATGVMVQPRIIQMGLKLAF